MADEEVFPTYPPASWMVGDVDLSFPVQTLEETGSNRIIERERPFRDGAKLDDTGAKATRWTMTVCFNNSIEEEGVNNADALYPTVLNQMIRSFELHETGNLIVPTIGVQRARAESYRRTETFEKREEAQVTFTWVADNEDTVDFRSISAPTVNANARRSAEQASFDQDSIGSADESLDSLRTTMTNIEDLANSPTSYKEEIEASANQVKSAAKRGKQIFGNVGKQGQEAFTLPTGARSERGIVKMEDMAGRSTNDARGGRPALIRVQAGRDTTLAAIATFVRQPYADILDINTVPNPNFVPSGSIVKVFANTGSLQQQGKPQPGLK